jgi:long-chain acyl-CoA synthetase
MSQIAYSTDTTISDRERGYLQLPPDYTAIQSMPEVWPLARSQFGNTLALCDPHAKPVVELTFGQLCEQIQQFAAGVQSLGLPAIANNIPPRVALFSNDSPRWMIADQGLLTAGAADVVRGADADREELLFILQNSGSMGLVVENLALLKKLRPQLDDLPIQWIIYLSDEPLPTDDTLPVQILSFQQVMAKGASSTVQPVTLTRETLATLIYTSGTTGKPKGVMLTHGNLLHQVETLPTIMQPEPGDRVITILPTWHSFGRMGQYFLLSRGCSQFYTNIRYLKADLKEYHPKYTIGVPRLWESIYEGVQKQFREQPANRQKLVKTFFGFSQNYIEAGRILQGLQLQLEPASGSEKFLAAIKRAVFWPLHTLGDRLVYDKVRQATGGQLKYVISGGGSLAMHIENFFEIIGIDVLVGYGLTETAPVLTARRHWQNLRGSAGRPMPYTELRIVHTETRETLKHGERGLVLARGPQVMQGYYQNPEATTKAIDPEGWFDTGDLGWLSPGNDLVLTGRAKDTIVLTNGENIEPQPIEDACIRSPYIDQMMLVGQDQKCLGALIVPNFEALQQWALSQNLSLRLPQNVSPGNPPPASGTREIDLSSPEIDNLFRQELNREVKNRPGYRPDDRIGPFSLLSEPFSMENGMLTQTLKMKRPVITERYGDRIDKMFV